MAYVCGLGMKSDSSKKKKALGIKIKNPLGRENEVFVEWGSSISIFCNLPFFSLFPTGERAPLFRRENNVA